MVVSIDLETDLPELVLNVGAITLGKKSREEMKSRCLRRREIESVSRALCVLLNSGGGVIRAKIENQQYSLSRDGIGLDLENSLYSVLPFVQRCLDFVEKDGHFYVFVKSGGPESSELPIVTLKTNLYMRSMSSSVEAPAAAALELLTDMKETGGRWDLRPELPPNRACACVEEECQVEDLAAEFFHRTKLLYKGEFPFCKSTHVEVRKVSTKRLLKCIKKIISRTVSAFANTDGGYLFIGLDAKKQQIIGFEAEESDLVHLESEIGKCVRQLPVYHFCEEKEEIKYLCRFIEVHGPGGVCSYVCALRVERFCCAVFAKQPDSWHVEDNCVKPFTTEEWVRHLMEGRAGSGRGISNQDILSQGG
ncbi:schlafen family member 12-like [Nannospalax galili]|uniref:schlafen family member 12-like n=1 Tax=Nannospalax galili TaxID=1026970 RepID=UPI00111C93A4|nr:schlafen family member 12-like [Nannospalax galili]